MGLIFSRSLFGFPRQKYLLESWIDSAEREAALDPDFPMIDAHHHMWDARTQDKGWPVPSWMIKVLYYLNPRIMVPFMAAGQDERVRKMFTAHFLAPVIPYMENEMLRDIENLEQSDQPLPPKKMEDSSPPGHNVRATVYVESGWDDPNTASEACKSVPEAAMAQSVAARTDSRLCSGIVAHVPLSEGADAVRPALRTLADGYPNVRGVRVELACREGMFPLDPKPKLAYGGGFRSGFALLEEFGLTFDTWLYHDQIPELRDLALAFPGTTVVCDHMAFPLGCPPYDRKTTFDEWKPLIQELAEKCPNVVVKLSGLGSPCIGFGYENRKTPPNSEELADAWGPYIRHCIECFGVDRCMFASNFPVDKVSCSYTALFNAFKRIVKDFSEEDRRKLFHDNAARIYRLEVN